MPLTERTYVCTLRAELDHEGNVTLCETHQRREVLRDGDVIDSRDARVEMDEAAFSKVFGKQLAAALAQVKRLSAEVASLNERISALTAKTPKTSPR